MSAKHTPGPWSVWRYEDLTITDKFGRHLAVMRNGAPEKEANVRLIVRAVNTHEELLEAAKAVLKMEKGARTRLAAVIAKAEEEGR